jgi:hypothetical protein
MFSVGIAIKNAFKGAMTHQDVYSWNSVQSDAHLRRTELIVPGSGKELGPRETVEGEPRVCDDPAVETVRVDPGCLQLLLTVGVIVIPSAVEKREPLCPTLEPFRVVSNPLLLESGFPDGAFRSHGEGRKQVSGVDDHIYPRFQTEGIENAVIV